MKELYAHRQVREKAIAEELAALAGTATESLIRTLGDFRSEKILDIKEGYITVMNTRKLELMVN